MPLHLYFGDDHRMCPMCGYELPIEYFIVIGKKIFCQSCSKRIKEVV